VLNASCAGAACESFLGPGSSNNALARCAGAADTSKVMSLRANGNVGIGTTAPGFNLDVAGAIRANGTIVGTSGASHPAWALNAVDSTQTYKAMLVGNANSLNNAYEISFNYAGAGSTANRIGLGFYGNQHLLNIQASGNVGIGTTSPVDLMHIYSSGTSANLGYVSSNGSRQWRAGIRGDTNSAYVIQDDTSGLFRMAISSNGNVSTPGQTFFEAKLCSNTINPGNGIIWETVITNIGNAYNSTDGKFTAPASGVYQFGFNLLMPNAASGDLRVAFYKNGTGFNHFVQYKQANTWDPFQGVTSTYLNAGDTVWLVYLQGSGSIYVDCSFNRFWGRFAG